MGNNNISRNYAILEKSLKIPLRAIFGASVIIVLRPELFNLSNYHILIELSFFLEFSNQ